VATTLYLVSAEATSEQLAQRLAQARFEGIEYVMHPEDSEADGLAARYLPLYPLINEGVGYWKVGVTRHPDPLKRDRRHYREVFRAVEFNCEADARRVELQIAQWFAKVAPSVHGREAAHHSTQLGVLLEIFDACVDNREPASQPFDVEVARRTQEPMWA
jgi:hypothetical protein